jgi:hypothetical protein
MKEGVNLPLTYKTQGKNKKKEGDTNFINTKEKRRGL